MTTKQNNATIRGNDDALQNFIGRKTQIDTLIAEIGRASADHFSVNPDDVNWGHVGTLSDYAKLLQQVADSIYRRGEHAQVVS